MAFVPEDGTGLAEANSYCAVAFADSYFADRGNALWAAATTGNKEVALIKATDYIEGRFGDRFVGDKATTEQALQWPRINSDFASDVIPTNLKKATAEYAVRALSAVLAPDLAVDASGVITHATRKKVGPIETEFAKVTTGLGSSVMLFKPYPAADMLLKGLVVNVSGRVIR